MQPLSSGVSRDPDVWRVALIVRFPEGDGKLRVQLFERHSMWCRSKAADRGGFQSEVSPSTSSFGFSIRLISQRRLILTRDDRVISADDVLDCALVVGSEVDLKDLPGDRAFFCDLRIDSRGSLTPLKQAFQSCAICVDEARGRESLYQRFRESVRLPAVDYYSGGGGGIIGGSDYFDHCHAVEKEAHACRTLMEVSHYSSIPICDSFHRRNFPGMQVHMQTVEAASQVARQTGGRRYRCTVGGEVRHGVALPPPGGAALALAGPPW